MSRSLRLVLKSRVYCVEIKKKKKKREIVVPVLFLRELHFVTYFDLIRLLFFLK